MVNREKYALKRKEYNSDKTFVQISKELHKKIKEHCKNKGIKVKDFLENIISESIS
jgi:predicted HicB family RNase H-like nuclease